MPDTGYQPTYTFKRAKREGVGLFIGISGGTGSGKSYTALELATGIAGPDGMIAAADTEGRRLSHYDSKFVFDVVDLLPPFRPMAYETVAKDAEAAGAKVLLVDSMSHEWAGDGGVLEWHDEFLDRAVAKAMQNAREGEYVDEEKVRNANNMRAWVTPKVEHKRMIQSFLQRRIPIIFCFRAEEKVKVLPNGRIEAMGWTPVGDQRFMFELTVMITLANDTPGCTRYDLPRKIQEQHLHLFPDKRLITREAGAKLAAWARGEDISPAPRQPAGENKKLATNGNGKKQEQPSTDKTTAIVDALLVRINEMTDPVAVDAIFKEDLVNRQVVWMRQHREDQHSRLMKAADDKIEALNKAAKEAQSPEPPTQDNEVPKTEVTDADRSSPPTEGEQLPEA